MADLTQEQFEAVPDFLKEDYQKDGEVYRHVAEFKAAKLKTSLDGLDNKLKETSGRLSEIEKQKEAEFEKKLADELEKARTSGDAKALEERLRQQFEDRRRRDREEARTEALTEFKTQQAQEKASSLADKIGLTIGVDPESGELIADAIRARIKIDPQTGEKIFYDTKGSALSVDEAGFMNEIANERRFARLVRGEVNTTGGGNAQGSNGGSASKKPQDYTEQERVNLYRTNRAEFDRLFAKP